MKWSTKGNLLPYVNGGAENIPGLSFKGMREDKRIQKWSLPINPLFLTVKKPFRAVKPTTIMHWLKNFMKEAVIDISAFTAHSTRELLHQKQRQCSWYPRQQIGALVQHSASFIIDLPMTGLDSQGECQTIPCSKLTMLSIRMYLESPVYNYRFPKDRRSDMGRINCMRRWRIHVDNIVSFPPNPIPNVL